MLACNEEILKEKRSLSRQTPVFDLFKSSSGSCTSPRALLDIGDDDDPDDQPNLQFKRKVSSLNCNILMIL